MEKNEKDGYNPLEMIVSCFIATMYRWYNSGRKCKMFICEPHSQERVKASIKALGEVSARVI